MKHVLVNKDGQTHAVIMACPFKYTLPRNMTVYEDNPSMGRLPVDAFAYTQPKPQDDCNAHAIDFAVIKDGIIQGVTVWGGAEWLPPFGSLMMPLPLWMGKGDLYHKDTDTFEIHDDRLGQSDKDKTVAELQADQDAIEIAQIEEASKIPQE